MRGVSGYLEAPRFCVWGIESSAVQRREPQETLRRMRSNASDAALLLESSARPEMFDEVFERHFDAIYGFAARQLGAHDGEEVAAETFSRAFADRARFRGDGSARAWLFGICVNVIREQRRRSTRRLVADGRAAERDLALDEGSESRLDALDQHAALRHALAGLRPPERDTIGLLALGQLTYGEIAEALGLPVGTVRSHVFRGRRALQAALATDKPTESRAVVVKDHQECRDG
jgi:RNA polymerase sigma factor (sigma-70 family)